MMSQLLKILVRLLKWFLLKTQCGMRIVSLLAGFLKMIESSVSLLCFLDKIQMKIVLMLFTEEADVNDEDFTVVGWDSEEVGVTDDTCIEAGDNSDEGSVIRNIFVVVVRLPDENLVTKETLLLCSVSAELFVIDGTCELVPVSFEEPVIDATCAVGEMDAVSNTPCGVDWISDEDVASDICPVVGCVPDEDIVPADVCIVGYISDDVSVVDDLWTWVPWSSEEDSVTDVNSNIDDPDSGVEGVCDDGCANE
ncbi:hypothetical protein chiPu_0026417 [Chiloscyllium punctatum]|uniref:Uncharacterized protein n=1 Tax=Chiloscyllium punctatum TaxID=137246 RepID=A0A401THB3_CHIPU|nr:hypothetical protein [Chiloscyllium punctatum]